MPAYTYVILIVASWFLLPHASKMVARLMYPSKWADFSFVIALVLEVLVIVAVVLVHKYFWKGSVIGGSSITANREAPAQNSKTRPNRLWLKILSVIYGAAIPPVLFIAAFAFDGPSPDFGTFLFSSTLAAMPWILVASCVGGLICSSGELSNSKKWWGRIFATLPILNFVLFAIIYVAVGAT